MAAKPMPDVAYLRECFDYNPMTGVLSWKHKRAGKPAGWKHGGAVKLELDGVAYYAHRIIWAMQTGDDPGTMEIDHRNRDQYDNRWRNLRLATRTENARNRLGWSKAFPTGVRQKGARYEARIAIGPAGNSRYIHLGSFATLEEAACAYREFARKAHGQFYPETIT